MNAKSLGRRLRSYRAKCGLSLEECSERIGISTRYLADIERGDKIPKLETLLLILNTLNASCDDVLQDSLAIGYIIKADYVTNLLKEIDADKREKALDAFKIFISLIK